MALTLRDYRTGQEDEYYIDSETQEVRVYLNGWQTIGIAKRDIGKRELNKLYRDYLDEGRK